MAPESICFWGSDPIALPMLNWLVQEATGEVCLAAVVTQPDRPSGRGRKLQANPIKRWAEENEVEIRQPERPGAAEVEWMRSRGFSLGLVMAYGKILSRALLETPPLGMWNLHGSLLPDLRGASPLETALAEGYAETGVTLMRMVPRMDAGPVVDREVFPIARGETAPGLRARAGEVCVPLLQRNLAGLLRGEFTLEPQSEAAATYCRKLTKEDGRLDFELPAVVLEQRHRACTPWPGSSFQIADTVLKVGKLSALGEELGNTGQLLVQDERICIGTSRGSIEIEALQKPGGKMLPAPEFLRGFRMETGTQLVFPKSAPWRQHSPFS